MHRENIATIRLQYGQIRFMLTHCAHLRMHAISGAARGDEIHQLNIFDKERQMRRCTDL